MDFMGFTLNNITLLGLILAIGIVIDDAVVVHENIFRFMEEKRVSAREAASEATSEIALAVVATTLSLLVIFIPVAFMGGRVGRFFSSFGFVVGFSLLVSMFISFTLTPMLCSRFLLMPENAGHGSKSGILWRLTEGSYIAILRWSLKHRWVIVLTSLAVFLSTPVIFGMIGKDFGPRDDQSEFELAATLPEGYTLERADEVMGELDRRFRALPGVLETYTVIGETSGRVAKGQGDVTKGSIYVRLTDLPDRPFTPFVYLGDPEYGIGRILNNAARAIGFGRMA
jgi:HAE1 family hydrophobic/amphiphilic exporter-1